MLSFLKKLMKKEQPIEAVAIKEADLERWIQDRSLPILKEEEGKVKGFVDELEGIKQRTLANLETLEHAQLKNKDIPNRHLQFLNGNRPVYIQKTRTFLEGISLQPSFDALEPFYLETIEKIVQFTKHTTKSYMVMQEFFANESFRVAEGIKAIENTTGSIKDYLRDSPYAKVTLIRKHFDELRHLDKKQADLKEMIDEKKKTVLGLEGEIRDINERIVTIKKGDAFRGHQKRQQLIEELRKKRQDLRYEISREFSMITKAMRKYERISLEPRLINRYLDEPYEALLNDTDLEITGILERMSQGLTKGTIDVKSPRKTLDAIDHLAKELLTSWQAKIHSLEDELASSEGDSSAAPMLRELKDLDHRLPLLQQDIDRETMLMGRHEKDLGHTDKGTIITEIVKESESLFNSKITLG